MGRALVAPRASGVPLLCALALCGCGTKVGGADSGSAVGAGSPSGTSPTGTPAGTTVPSSISAVCNPTDNPLRMLCDVYVQPPQPVDVTFWLDGDAVEHTLSSETQTGEHHVPVFLLKQNRPYLWRATPRLDPESMALGSFSTGKLDGGCLVDVTSTGASTAPYFIVQSPCSTDANVLVIDRDGDVVWCEDFSPTVADPTIEGISLTEDGTVMAVVADQIVEKDFAGNDLLRLARGVDFDPHIHHDVFRKNGLTYLLFNETVDWQNETYVLDGFYIFDGNTRLGEWHLFDHFQPAGTIGWPGSDYSHANAIWTDGSGEGLVSFRHLSAVARIVFDTSSPDFGNIVWRLAGEGLFPEFGTDFDIVSSVGANADFERQHNVHILPNGELALLDNRAGLAENSRLLHLDLDVAGRQADITAEYPLPMHCDFQGGAWHTDVGNPVATCAPMRTATEFDAATGAPLWEATVDCQSAGNAYIPRFIPWQGPW